MAALELVDCDVQGTSQPAVLYQDNLLRRDGLADHAVKGLQEVGRILLPVDAHQHAIRGMRIEGLWIMGIQTLIQTHSLAPSGWGGKTDVTAVIGSFCNQSTCGRHVNPVLSLQMNPELVFFKRNANRIGTAKPRSLPSTVDFGILLRHTQPPSLTSVVFFTGFP